MKISKRVHVDDYSWFERVPRFNRPVHLSFSAGTSDMTYSFVRGRMATVEEAYNLAHVTGIWTHQSHKVVGTKLADHLLSRSTRLPAAIVREISDLTSLRCHPHGHLRREHVVVTCWGSKFFVSPRAGDASLFPCREWDEACLLASCRGWEQETYDLPSETILPPFEVTRTHELLLLAHYVRWIDETRHSTQTCKHMNLEIRRIVNET